MAIKDLGIKELRAAALERLGSRAAELKTRQELVDALEAKERKAAPKKAAVPAVVAPSEPGEVPGPRAPEFPAAPLEAPPIGPIPTITAEAFAAPEPISTDFFLDPDVPRLPTSYGDDRVLTFARDPSTLYAAWDFGPDRRPDGGVVVNAAGDPVRVFPIGTAVGGVFLEQLPSGIALKVEVRAEGATVGESGWVTMPLPPRSAGRSDASSPA